LLPSINININPTSSHQEVSFLKLRSDIHWPVRLAPPLWSSGQSSSLHNGDVLCFL
jgi:hypothetical protein